MVDKTTGLGKALWLGALLSAAIASTTAHAQSMVGIPPVKTAAPTGVPTISGNPTRMLVAGTFYDFRPSASDPNGDRLTFSINHLPRWATFDTATGRLNGTPVTSDVGKIKGIVITVTDGTNKKSLKKFGIKIVAGKPPQIAGNPGKDAKEGEAYVFQPTASDPDGQKLEYGIINRPSWAKFDPSTGRLAGTPPKGSAGTYANVGISVTDGANTASIPPFTITVAAPSNTAPKISGTPAASVQVGQVYDFVPAASDAEGDALKFAIVSKPAWATFDPSNGRLAGKPATGNEGTYADVVISVSDGALITFLAPFSINVTAAPANKTPAPNSPPTISGSAPTTVVEGATYAFQPSAADADGDPIVFSASNLPAWLTINSSTGALGGTPGAGSSGTYTGIIVTVSDGKAPVSLPAFSITVTKPTTNSPPTITGVPSPSAKEGINYSFQPSASDADGQVLAFGIANKPSWASFNTGTGRLSGTPPAGSTGTYAGIVISVSDGQASATLPAFSISVAAASVQNRAPTISGSPTATVTEGAAYAFQPKASDADGDALTFTATGVPAWLNFNGSTGSLSGTPPAGSAGTYPNIVISVSDGQASAALPGFAVIVLAAANKAPTISGTPATTVTAGQAYSFVPTASDPDGQALGFGIANKPSWATFDIKTGQLSGTPSEAQTGTYANIVISVSDGQLSATLPAFALTVKSATPPNTGSAELTWVAPTENEDGSPLSDLAGFRIRYGNSPEALGKIVTVVGAATTGATIEGLATGTWYFSVAAYTTSGIESAPAGPVYKTIQ
jgi:hypothetical protein